MIFDVLKDPTLDPGNKAIMLGCWLLALVIAITVHEFAHARSARAFGDPTAQEAGRNTLNPLAHYDLVGTTLLLWQGFGWAKPVPIDPSRMRNPRRHALLVSLWGPFSNILMAALLILPIRLAPQMPELLLYFLLVAVMLNLGLAIFNMIPIPPLDGSHIITYLLPPRAAESWERFNAQFGFILMIGILWFGGSLMGRFTQTATDYLMALMLYG